MNIHRKLLLFSQVRQYYAKFKKTGNPRTAKIEKTEFCDIMQNLYPRTYKTELAEDIFRIYDLDNNGTEMQNCF